MTSPVDRSTNWPYEDGRPGRFSYARTGHPTGEAVEEELGRLDGGRALLFPSGMSAATTVLLALARPDGLVALGAGSYYGTAVLFRLLEPWGVRVVEFDQTGPPPADAALVWVEAPANPMLTMPDLAAATAFGVPVVCDSTVATPLGLRPLEFGCDVALHSATKYLGGHDDVLAGVAVVRDDDVYDRLRALRSATGAVASPDAAALLARGLKTLAVRVERQAATAADLAERLRAHPSVRDRPLPGARRPRLLRRCRRGGREPRRDVAGHDRERDEPRRHRLEAGEPPPLGGRPLPAGPAPPLGRTRGRGRPLGRPRARARAGLNRT